MELRALKEFTWRRCQYAAGEPLPADILHSIDLREFQRRGFVPCDFPEDPLVPVALAAEPASLLPEAPGWLLEAPAKPAKGGRGRR